MSTTTPSKRWYQSKTVWGALLSAAATAVSILSQVFGWNIPLDWIVGIAGALGVTVTIYGRSVAKAPLGK